MIEMPVIGQVHEDELSIVMQDVLELTGGWAIGLAVHATGQDEPTLVYFEEDKASPRDGAAALALGPITSTTEWMQAEPAWYPGPDGSNSLAFQIPMRPVTGHGRVVISVLFDELDAAERRQVEQAYARRRTIARAYFRLWQVERLRRRRTESLEAALDLTQLGVILMDQSANITFANNAAEQILAARDGLRRVGNALRATDLSEGVRLQVALNHVAAANEDGSSGRPKEAAAILALHRKSGPPLILSLLAPETAGTEPTDVATIAFLVDPQRDTAAMLEPVCRLYQLSPVETQLVCHLAQGRTVAEASELMRIKEQTARSYMKQIFIKTDTNRQTELVVLILSSVVRMKSGQSQKALGSADLFAPRSLLRA